jgi:hypothetical protein
MGSDLHISYSSAMHVKPRAVIVRPLRVEFQGAHLLRSTQRCDCVASARFFCTFLA